MDEHNNGQQDAVETPADDTANVRAMTDEEVAAYRNEEIAKLGTTENVRPVSDAEKTEFLAEQNAGVDADPVDTASE